MNTHIYINLPSADLEAFVELMKERGWQYEMKEDLLCRYMESRRGDVDLTDEEIAQELAAVRYANR